MTVCQIFFKLKFSKFIQNFRTLNVFGRFFLMVDENDLLHLIVHCNSMLRLSLKLYFINFSEPAAAAQAVCTKIETCREHQSDLHNVYFSAYLLAYSSTIQKLEGKEGSIEY